MGDTALIGAIGADSAYVFRFDGTAWIQTQKLLPSGGQPGDSFGNAVAIDGDRAMIGARGDDGGGTNTGAVYFFRFDGKNWIEQQKLVASDADHGDAFGISVSISGDLAVIGAFFTGGTAGSAYVFRFDRSTMEWVEERLSRSPGRCVV